MSVGDTLKSGGIFSGDIERPGMVHCVTIRSRRAAARILGIDAPTLPRDLTLLTARDIPGANTIDVYGETMPVLAPGKVTYIGEPVALLAGPSLSSVLSTAKQIELRYDETDPVFTFEAALPQQIVREHTFVRGTPDETMSNASQVVEGAYRTGVQEHMYNDPFAAFAELVDGILDVATATQWPHHVARTVAAVTGRPIATCRVRVAETGIPLDGKLWYPALPACHAAIVALVCGRPARLVYTRLEDFLFTPKRSPAFVRHTTGLDENGDISAMDVDILFDTGAYPVFTDESISRYVHAATGVYNCANTRLHVAAVRTNHPPLNVFQGLATAQASFASESHAARIVEVAQTEPIEWRTRNMHTATRPGRDKQGRDKKPGGPIELMRRVAEVSDFRRKYAAFELQKKRRPEGGVEVDAGRGIGIAVCTQGTGLIGRGEDNETTTVRVRMEQNGTVEVSCAAVAEGSSLFRLWRRQVAEILSVKEDDVRFRTIDTLTVPDTGPSAFSRNAGIVTKLVTSACDAIQRRRFRDPLPIEVKRTYKLPAGVRWSPEKPLGDAYAHTAWAACVVEVETNSVTFSARVRGVWICVDGGEIGSFENAYRSIERSIVASLGWSSTEDVSFTAGTVSRIAYPVVASPHRARPDSIWVDFIASNEPIKGIGELPANCVPAAYCAAVTQATGRYVDTIPATPDVIYAYLEEE